MYRVALTSPRASITELDSIPIPDRSLVDYEKYHQFVGDAMVKNCMSLQATRGCPYNCIYCHKIWAKKHFVRSAEHILDEIKRYYDMGVKKFSFVDDIFNLNIKNSTRFFQMIVKGGLDLQLFFPNGLRGDILTKDYIDLMIEAGTVKIALALETASPRLQKLIGKNLNIEKFRKNIEYICEKHPQLILDLFTMCGFPTETKEEIMMTWDFIRSLKWVHFPYINILKIFPKTDLEKVAVKNGVPVEAIARSKDLAYNELPDTLPFSKEFVLKNKTEFVEEYFLAQERLLHVLPYQMRILTKDEMVQYYSGYLNVDLKTIDDLLQLIGISPDQVDMENFLPEEGMRVTDLNENIARAFPNQGPDEDALRVLLIDLTQSLTIENPTRDLIEAPLGLMYLISYLRQKWGSKINGRILKSRIDFDSYDELKEFMDEFDPEVIGIRTLTWQADLFKNIVEKIREWGWGPDVPIVAGGPYATSDYESILQDRNVDVVVLGEGEVTFNQLITEIMKNGCTLPGEETLSKIAGIAYVPQEAVREVEKELLAPLYEDLDDE